MLFLHRLLLFCGRRETLKVLPETQSPDPSLLNTNNPNLSETDPLLSSNQK